MILHNDTKLFKQAIQATSQYKGLLAIYVEKDYWVTLALHIIFHSDLRESVVFKGGTALSKAFKSIERFSEDIDLVLLRNENETSTQLKKRLKQISNIVSEQLPEFALEGITRKMGMNRKTAHSYQHNFNGNFGQIRDCIILETSWLGNYEPYTKLKLNSFIYEMMITKGQEKIAETYGLSPFEVLVLESKRTICEKIMSLTHFSYSKKPIEELKLKIRHIYDITRLLSDNDILQFVESSEFDKMLLRVAKDDVHSFRQNKWLERHPKDAIIFVNPEKIWKELKLTYHNKFKDLVYGELPSNEEIISSLNKIVSRISTVNWSEIKSEFSN